jgi:hypothetical protein
MWPHSSLLLFPTAQATFHGSFIRWFWWLNSLPFYMLDPRLLHSFLNLMFYQTLEPRYIKVQECNFPCRQSIHWRYNSWATLSTSSELICFLGEIKSEAELWNGPQSMKFVNRVQKIPSSNTIQQVENDSHVIRIRNVRGNDSWQCTTSCRRVMSGTWWCWNFKLISMQ